MELARGDDLAARMLSLWNPPAYLSGCTQAALRGASPVLARNYDYARSCSSASCAAAPSPGGA